MYSSCMLRKCQCFIPRMTCKAPHKHMALGAGLSSQMRVLTIRSSDMHRLYRAAGHGLHPSTMICGILFLRFINLLQLHIIHPLIGLRAARTLLFIYTRIFSFTEMSTASSSILFVLSPPIISVAQRHHLRCSTICMKSRATQRIIDPASD